MESAGVNFCLTADDSSGTKWLPVHVGIAMKNAPEHVKSKADEIAPSNEEDGVATIIEKYFL